MSGALIVLPVMIPWLAAPMVAFADGRRRAVGLIALAALVASLAMTGVLAGAGAGRRAASGGRR